MVDQSDDETKAFTKYRAKSLRRIVEETMEKPLDAPGRVTNEYQNVRKAREAEIRAKCQDAQRELELALKWTGSRTVF